MKQKATRSTKAEAAKDESLALQKSRLKEIGKIFGKQEKIAGLLGISVKTYSQYTSGARKLGTTQRQRFQQLGINGDYAAGESNIFFADNEAGKKLEAELKTLENSEKDSNFATRLPEALSHVPKSHFSHYKRIPLYSMTSEQLPQSVAMLPVSEMELHAGIPITNNTIGLRVRGSSLESSRIFDADIIIIEKDSIQGNALLYSLNNQPVIYRSNESVPEEAVLIGSIRMLISYW